MIADAKREQQRLDAETERELALLEEQRNNADKIVAEQLRQRNVRQGREKLRRGRKPQCPKARDSPARGIVACVSFGQPEGNATGDGNVSWC